MNSLAKRVITAVILIPVTILAMLFLPNFYFSLAVAIVMTLAAWEWVANLVAVKQTWQIVLYLILLWISFIGAWFLPEKLLFNIGVLWWVTAIFVIFWYVQFGGLKNLVARKNLWISFFVLVPCLFGFKYLQGRSFYHLFSLLLIVWSADTGAYFAGMFCGKHKLMSKVSPKKTIEGLIGGMIFAIIVAGIWSIMNHVQISSAWLLLVATTVLFSALGDLFESMLKRIANCKDSSNLLPGHGGIFDRIDSLTAAVPIYALGLLIIS